MPWASSAALAGFIVSDERSESQSCFPGPRSSLASMAWSEGEWTGRGPSARHWTGPCLEVVVSVIDLFDSAYRVQVQRGWVVVLGKTVLCVRKRKDL